MAASPLPNPNAGTDAVTLADEEELVRRYPHEAPVSEPGDLVVVDFLTLHRSGRNTAKRSRWSMQMRYFNFREPTGLKMGWPGSFAAGVDLAEVHPEMVVG